MAFPLCFESQNAGGAKIALKKQSVFVFEHVLCEKEFFKIKNKKTHGQRFVFLKNYFF